MSANESAGSDSLLPARDYEADFGLQWALWGEGVGVQAYTAGSVQVVLDRLVAALIYKGVPAEGVQKIAAGVLHPSVLLPMTSDDVTL